MAMIRTRKVFFTAMACAVALSPAWAQVPQFVTLDIGWENGVGYIDDLADPSKLVTVLGAATANIRNFMMFLDVGDIVSVNGRPAQGNWLLGGRIVQMSPSPSPGQAKGDIGRGAMADMHLEILQTDGTPIGTIMMSGFSGGSGPPGSRPNSFGNLTVAGGTGAWLGARGFSASPSAGFRPTSVVEDPANRRNNGGTS